MDVGRTTIDGTEVWFGRSICGYMTRLHGSEEEAIAEGAWLDARWEDCRAFWDRFFQHRDEEAIEYHAGLTLLSMMKAARKGLRPLNDPECPESFRLYRSEGEGESERIVVETDEHFLGEFDGGSYSEIRERLDLIPDFRHASP